MKSPKTSLRKDGSALVLTLLVVGLLVILVLGFSVVVRMELKSVILVQESRRAEAQARLGLELGIARLQELAGPDTRITGTAELVGAVENPKWTGVWDTAPGSSPNWLVSGVGVLNPLLAVPAPFVALAPDVQAALVPSNLAGTTARLAWWVADEGVKARVDVVGRDGSTLNPRERALLSMSPSSPDFRELGAVWKQGANASRFAPTTTTWRSRIPTTPSLSLAVGGGLGVEEFHSLSLHGQGLPVNVRDGGLKSDWSVVLDRAKEGSSLVERELGAQPTRSPFGADAFAPPNYGADIWGFPVADIQDPDRFFLSDLVGNEVRFPSLRAGPNLGILWHYGKLWTQVQNGASPMVGLHPRINSNMRTENWLPYRVNVLNANSTAEQAHTNSGIMPLVSHLRLGLRILSQLEPAMVDPVSNLPLYRLQLELKPLIGLWNPYSVGIKSDDYYLEWDVRPMIKLNVIRPDGTQQTAIAWLRIILDSRNSATSDNRALKLKVTAADFEAGELRLFSVDRMVDFTNMTRIPDVEVTSAWSAGGAVRVDYFTGTSVGALTPLRVPEGSRIEIVDVYLQDTHHPDTQAAFTFSPNDSMTWVTFKARGEFGVFLTRHTGLWNSGTSNRAATASEITVPERIRDAASVFPVFTVESLAGGLPEELGTWSFHLRTTTQMEVPTQRLRGWIDADPRAPVAATRWDGARKLQTQEQDGWYFLGAYMGGSLNMPHLTDGHGGNRGLVTVGGVGNPAPQSDGSVRYRGYLGATDTPSGGRTHVPVFDVPRAPLVSVGQFQHAQLSRYSYEPGFVLGNSYANVRIPLNAITATNFNGLNRFNLHDISYEVNQRIWDEVFFSTLAPDYVGGGASWDTAFAGRLDRLPNPRMEYVAGPGPTSLDAYLAAAGTGGIRGAAALAARIRIRGAFNVNSTSKMAWKAVLSSMAASELPVVNPLTGALSWENPEGIRFVRFGHVLNARPYNAGEGNHVGFWQGWRKLNATELDALAGAMAEDVKARGPFRSLSDFVNRNPASSNVEHQRKGALQSALDRTVNTPAALPTDLGRAAQRPNGALFSNAMNGESEASGFAGFILQGDVLQSLAPILQARSDTFVVRAYGDMGSGTAAPRAWCEAVVQRRAEYVNDSNLAWHHAGEDTMHPVNARFGRRFEIVSFRWLKAEEVEAGL